MRKTLLIAQIFPPSIGGVQNYLFNICKRLPADSIVVLAHKQKGNEAQENAFDRAQPFKIIRTNFTSSIMWPRWLPLISKVRRIIKTEQIEHIMCGEVIPTGTIALAAKKQFTVFTYGRDLVLPKKSAIKNYIATRVLQSAQHIITISAFTKKLIQSYEVHHVPETAKSLNEKIFMLAPGVDHQFFSPEKIDPTIKAKYHLEHKKILLSIGRLDRRKGFDAVIKLMPDILKRVPNAHYIIVGQGQDKIYLQSLIGEYHLEHDVTIIEEKISDAQLPYFYTMADVFITISRDMKQEGNVEGFGIVFIEANAAGIPVIGGLSGGTADAIIDGKTGFLVHPDNHAEIIERTSLLLIDTALAKQLGEQGRRRAVLDFDWDKKINAFKESIDVSKGTIHNN